ncbi:C cytochrome precursor [Stieleria sp. JC731]|uniref:multiheme c-type cytochrome n=1 Tax=Pirellulaceae TaxID=2691357 RepID=UPI001E364014|nr:multiheme c-type cytochrome [Stieleria sp. JC731]MCC9600439.1 C cytochrome precursor [Stieleria sp. JC731]
MNSSVLIVSALISILVGAFAFRITRSIWSSIAIPLIVVGAVWFVLPKEEPAWTEANTDKPLTAQTRPTKLAELESFRPIEVPSHGYVGSDACKECHQDNHASWFASYHRTMTQLPTDKTVEGDFDDVLVTYQGQDFRLDRHGELYTVDMPDLGSPVADARLKSSIVLCTGSHHMQLYWYATGVGRMLALFPLAHDKETGEWIPRDAAFLRPRPIGSHETGRWNETCSKCHSTHRKGRQLPQQGWDTHVGEFGISCEACHGPGSDHIRYHKNPRQFDRQTDTIVNPVSLPKERSVEVCGQCHSIFLTPRSTHGNQSGNGYRPGKVLTDSHLVVRRDSPEYAEQQKAMNYATLDQLLDESYYEDGMVRVSGREYNAVTDSACYQRGEMTCFSCHQLHQAKSDTRTLGDWANDQLHPDALDNTACLNCHQQSDYGSAHTHHLPGSSGSQCYNCHMPHTTYGLLKGIRSHTISSPDVGRDRDANRPNACNQCHLDKTLQWSAEHLHRWYDIAAPMLEPREKDVAASLLWLLNGNAANRALAAWTMGWDQALQASGNRWQAPLLAELLNDDYQAIRYIARRSLRSLPGFTNMKLDVVMQSTDETRSDAIETIRQHWLKNLTPENMDRPELLLSPAAINLDRLRSLYQQRDQTPMSIAE